METAWSPWWTCSAARPTIRFSSSSGGKNVRIVTGFKPADADFAITERTPATTQAELVEGLLQIGASENKGVREKP